MKNANWTRILTILLSLLALYACLAVVAGLLQRFIVPVLLVLLAAIFAFILTPIVDILQKRLHFFRGLAIVTTYLLLAAVLASLGYFLTSPLVSQTKALADAIKNPTHIENVIRVHNTSTLLVKQTTALQAGVLKYVNTPNLCGKVCPGFANCYLAYYLGEPQSPFATQGNCIGPQGFWRVTFGAHWRKRLGSTVPNLIDALQREISDLGRTTVSATSATTASRPTREARIPATRVPSSYTKPLMAALAKLMAAVTQGQKVVVKDETKTSLFISRSDHILREAKAVAKDARSLTSLVRSTPIIILALQNQIDSHHLPINVRSLLGSAVGKLRGQGTSVLNNAVAILTGTVNVVFDLIIIVIMSLYMVADGPRFIGWVMGLIPDKHRQQAWFFVESLSKVLGGYVRGQLIVATTIGILAGLGCYVIGVPYALLLGIFAFLAESIPVMGPVLASIPAIVVSLFTVAPLRTAFVVGWFILIQQVEQNVVGPRITGRAVGIHPVAAMIAVIIGLEVGGIWGAFLAVPVTGILFVVVGQSYSYLVLRKPLPTAEIPDSVEVEEIEREPSLPRT